jgi:hypothetical protein
VLDCCRHGSRSRWVALGHTIGFRFVPNQSRIQN